MVRMKKVSGSAGKEIITKERALKSFRKISNMTTVLTMRYDRQRIVSKAREEGNGDLANWYLGRWKPDPYSTSSNKELKTILNTELARYQIFWDNRLSGRNFFEEDCSWAPECRGLVILREGRKPIVLIERTVEMLMLLSDSPPTVGDETIRTWGIRANFGFDPFTDYAVRLQTALHPDIRKYLIGTLDADQIVALMLTVSEGISNGSFTVRDLQKIVRSFGEREIELLGEYSAVRDMGDHTVIRPIKEHCGEEGNPVIEQIIEHMKSISRRLKRKLEIYGVTQNE